MVICRYIVVFVLVVTRSLGDEGHDQHSKLRDSKHVHDKDHIKEHLKEVTDVKEEPMSDEDLQFHYFKLHDYDNNNRLDGIELGNAMTHFHEEDGKESTTTYSDEQLASMVDQILEEDDMNKDGYIDYTEFVGAQKRVEEAPEKTEQ